MNEYASVNIQLDWKKAKSVVAGVDVGSVTSKAVILVDKQPYAISRVVTRTPQESAVRALDTVLSKTDLALNNIGYVVGTGCGRRLVQFAHKKISEIACAAAGAVHIWGPSVRTVLDGGGESCRVIHCNERGRATDFLYNDKCAAGIGRSMDTFADMTQQGLGENANIALQSDRFTKLSDFCEVYAQSEALDLLRFDQPSEEIIAGYHYAMAKRISTLVGRADLKKDFVIIGGLAKNQAIIDMLENILKVSRLAPKPKWDPQEAVALGAAIIADAFYKKQQNET